MIQTTRVKADKNPDYDLPPGNDTSDKIFLLSFPEANELFTSDEARKCVPTAYAIMRGACTRDSYSADGKATCWWWLRSWYDSCRAGNVDIDGVTCDYFSYVDINDKAVRPALWIILDQ